MNIEELNTQLEYLDETKSLIKQAIIDKGQSISENDTFRSFVQKINDIETGIEVANIPIWYSEAGISTSNPIEYEIENKTPISAWVMDKTTQLTRVDDYSTIRTIPEVGDLYIAISGFLRNNATEYYICLYQIEEITESGNELYLVVVPLVGERQDNFCTAIGLNTNVLKSGTQILGVSGKSTIVDTEEDNNAATSGDVVYGKIAYVNGQQIIGTVDEISAPDNFTGNISSFQDYSSFEPNTYIVQIANPTGQSARKVVIDPGAKMEGTISYSDMANQISNLQASNIKSGVSILGVNGSYSGTDTSDATALASNIEIGKTAYVNGQKITGSLNVVDNQGHPVDNSDPTNVTLNWDMGSSLLLQTAYDRQVPVIIKPNDPFYMAINKSTMASIISLTADKIKQGETILGITGTYDGPTLPYGRMLDNLDNINNTQISLRQDLSAITFVGDISGYSTTSGESYPITDCKIDSHSSMAVLANQGDVATAIGLTANKIKLGETILGVTGTYSDAMKEYASETAMNNDIANIQEGEVVKVVVTSGIAGDVDNPLTTTTTHFIKETTMKKLVKEEDTISPQEYEENVNLADDILGTE